MKIEKTINKNLQGMSMIIMATCLALTACDKDKEFTPAMPEAKLINSITFDVNSILPLAIDMDSAIVYKVEAPDDLEDRTLLWRSTNDAVARVSQDGIITGVTEGKAVISATPAIGFGAAATVTVNVVPQIIKAESVTLINPREGEVIYETDRLQFGTEILPVNHTYSYLTWTSSNEEVATVTKNGQVTCLKAGTTKILAYTHDHSKVFGSYDLTVVKYIPVENVEIKPYTDPICVSLGDINLDVIYTPSNATLGSVDWTSSNEDVAMVDLGVVTPKGFGTTEITATCQATGAKATTTITVVSGWWIWDGRNNFSNWGLGQAYSSFVIEDGKMVVTAGAQNTTMRRADLKYNAVPFVMDFGQYPVIALRTSLPSGGKGSGKGGEYTLDLVTDAGNVSGKKCNTGIILDDGSHMLYYNVAELNAAVAAAGAVTAKTFQVKIADIMNENLPTGKYTVYWIQTFKSLDEAIAYAKAEVAAGK